MKYLFLIIMFWAGGLTGVNSQTSFRIDISRLQLPQDFALTSDGGYIVGGNMLDTVTGLNDVFALVKVDSLGNEEWASMLSDIGHDSYVTSVIQASNGNFVFAGTPDGLITDKAVLGALDGSGNLQWSGSYALPGFQSYIAAQCIEASDHNFAMIIQQFDGWNSYISLIKLDSNGVIMWERNYADTINDPIIFNSSLAATDDNGFILTGKASLGSGFLLRVDSTGNPLWYKIYETYYQIAKTFVKQTYDHGFIVACSNYFTVGGQAFVIRTDMNGDTLWTKSIAGTEFHYLYSVVQTLDSNFVFAGSAGNFNTNSQKFFLIKMDQAGDTLWTRTYDNSTTNITGLNIKSAPDNGLITLCRPFIVTCLIKTDENGRIGCGTSNSITIFENHPTQVYNGVLTSVDSTGAVTSGGLFQQFYPPSTSISCYSVGVDYPSLPDDSISIHHNFQILHSLTRHKPQVINPLRKI